MPENGDSRGAAIFPETAIFPGYRFCRETAMLSRSVRVEFRFFYHGSARLEDRWLQANQVYVLPSG